jgi:hypothetical protein
MLNAESYFVVMNLAGLCASLTVAARLTRGATLPTFLLTTVVHWLVLTHTVILACGLVHALTPEVVTGVVVSAALIGGIAGGRDLRDRLHTATNDVPIASMGSMTWFSRLVMSYIAALLIYYSYDNAWRPLGQLDWDDQTYHAVYPTLWIRNRSLDFGTIYNYKAYYPQSGGVLAAWYLLPWRGESMSGMAWVGLTAIAYGLLFFLGTVSLVARCRLPWLCAAPPILLFFSSPIILSRTEIFSDVDVGLAAVQFAALVLTIGNGRSDEPRHSDMLGAALLAGLAVGFRPTALLPSLFLFVCWSIRSYRSHGALGVVRTTGLWLVCGVLVAGYWYLRNLLLTGNPVYPAAIAGLPAVTSIPRTRLSEYAVQYGYGKMLFDAVIAYLKWPHIYGVLAVAGGGALWFMVSRLRRFLNPTIVSWAVIATGVTAVILAPLLWQPFSAGWWWNFNRGVVDGASQRYLMLLMLIGWTSLGLSLGVAKSDPSLRNGMVGVYVGLSLAQFSFFWTQVELMLVTVIVLAALAAIVRMPAIFTWASRQKPLLISFLIVCMICGFAFRHPQKAALTRSHQLTKVFSALDSESDGARIWGFSPFGNHWIFSLFGSRFQHIPVPVDENGRRANRPEWEGDLFGGPPPLPKVSADEFVRNLREAGLTHVVTYDPVRNGDLMPPQHRLLAESGAASQVAAVDHYVLWRLVLDANSQP